MTKKRLKKYNPHKRHQKNPHGVVEDTAIYEMPGKKNEFINTRTGLAITPTSTNAAIKIADTYSKSKFDWTITLLVWWHDDNGNKKFAADDVAPPEPCKADDLKESIEQYHAKMNKRYSNNGKIKTAMAWVAVPYKIELSNKFFLEMLERENAWETYL